MPWRRGKYLAVAALCAALAGCFSPKPVSYNPPPAASPTDGKPRVTVKGGDTIYMIARENNVSLRRLIEVNGLEPPYIIHPGDSLILPPPPEHVVQRGETLYGISRLYRVDVYSLAQANNIGAPYTLRIGDRLRVPDAYASGVPAQEPGPAGGTETAIAAAPPPSQSPAPAQQGTGGSQLPVATQHPAPQPPPGVPGPAGPARPPSAAAAPPPPPASTPPPEPPRATQQTASVSAPPPEAAPRPAPRPAALPNPPPRQGGRFEWPLSGKVISGYGPKAGGLHNDGINIAARRGAAVRAAENGVVIYAGNELRGYGNMLLVRHADGWLTAYAHNDSLKVSRGDQVTKGQVIANAGASGNVSEPQLHFEIRRGSQAVDPLPLLGPASGGV